MNVTKAGEVILSGYGYEDTKTVYTVKTEPLPAGAKASAKSVTSATLVDPGKAQDVARRLYDYYQLRYTDEGQILPGQGAGRRAGRGVQSGRAHVDRLYPARCDRLVRRRSGNHYAERTVTHEYYRHAYHGPHPE